MSPSEGEFSQELFQQAKVKGLPQLGATRYEQDSIYLEFIYQDSVTGTQVFTVRLASPERIVFMPVPEWVVENIWQGDVDGTFHFESEAMELLESLRSDLQPEQN